MNILRGGHPIWSDIGDSMAKQQRNTPAISEANLYPPVWLREANAGLKVSTLNILYIFLLYGLMQWLRVKKLFLVSRSNQCLIETPSCD